MHKGALDGWVLVRHPNQHQAELVPPHRVDIARYVLLRYNPHVRRNEYVHVSELAFWRDQLRKERNEHRKSL